MTSTLVTWSASAQPPPLWGAAWSGGFRQRGAPWGRGEVPSPRPAHTARLSPQLRSPACPCQATAAPLGLLAARDPRREARPILQGTHSRGSRASCRAPAPAPRCRARHPPDWGQELEPGRVPTGDTGHRAPCGRAASSELGSRVGPAQLRALHTRLVPPTRAGKSGKASGVGRGRPAGPTGRGHVQE